MTIYKTFAGWYHHQIAGADLTLRSPQDSVYVVFRKKEARMVIKWLKLKQYSFIGNWNFGSSMVSTDLSMASTEDIINHLRKTYANL